jgi:hypothetical protein
MKKQLNNNLVDRFSRQIILKNIGGHLWFRSMIILLD